MQNNSIKLAGAVISIVTLVGIALIFSPKDNKVCATKISTDTIRSIIEDKTKERIENLELSNSEIKEINIYELLSLEYILYNGSDRETKKIRCQSNANLVYRKEFDIVFEQMRDYRFNLIMYIAVEETGFVKNINDMHLASAIKAITPSDNLRSSKSIYEINFSRQPLADEKDYVYEIEDLVSIVDDIIYVSIANAYYKKYGGLSEQE